MNLLTIIMPVRNCAQYIGRTLEKILSADNSLEVIIADGSSTDGTLNVIQIYKDKGYNIKVISHDDNGQSDALNKLIAEVKTEYFIWLNADDIILPEFITYVKDAIKNSKSKDKRPIISITANSIIIDQNDNFIKYQYGLRDQSFLVKNGIWFGKFPCRVWNTKLSRKNNGFKENLHYCMDFDFLRRQYQANAEVQTIHTDRFLGAFRHHDRSKTGNSQNTPLVKREVRDLLMQGSLKLIFFRCFSLLIRLVNVRYLFYRLCGRFPTVNRTGREISLKLRSS